MCGRESRSALDCGFIALHRTLLCGDGGGQSARALAGFSRVLLVRRDESEAKGDPRPTSTKPNEEGVLDRFDGQSYHATTFNETGHDVWSTVV